MAAQLVDITPHVSLLSKVGQSGHSVGDAVAELVDNAIDARVGRRAVTVEVVYNAREGWLRVDDDAAGMSRSELSDALVLALSSKAEEDIGRFGLGLKTACTSLGGRFRITSATRDSAMAWIAEYDEDEFLMSGEWKLPLRRQRKQRARGTSILIESSRLYPGLQQSLEKSLGWTFRHFLNDGLLRLKVNAVDVVAGEYEIDPDSVLPLKAKVAGKNVHGWVGLLQKSSQRGWYGFALIRHRRVVRRHEKLGFQPHPSTARVVGELHLDGFATNNLKTDFIRETADWRELEDWISRAIEPALAQSRALAHSGMLNLKIRAEIDRHRRDVLGDELESTSGIGAGNGSRSGDIGASRPVAVAIGSLHLEHVFVRAGEDEPYVRVAWEPRHDEADLLVVRTNLDHPASSQIADRSGWACHNLAESATLELSSRAEFVALKAVILRKLLSERALRRALVESARELLRSKLPEVVVAHEQLGTPLS